MDMTRRFDGVLFCLFVIGAYALAAALDIQPDRRIDWTNVSFIEAQHRDEAAQVRRDFAAQQACGPNAHVEWVSDTSIQCFTKRGAKAGKVAQL